ncbi:hypothetical protein LTS08_006000 [Lithohypha guttulata]|uniref:uncharacterized protein n=1 Tax=Lithohypha guttulata TaxID=1690604 RepID=UPI002DDFCA9C|nr:hypothetical protein LTR51_002514 [Lithohypha guttulata]KAK5099418.1 hypothetical protein LTS08_006000 [Lithohypha guttulata]
MASREGSIAASSEIDPVDDSRFALGEADDNASASDLPPRTATPSSTKGTKRPRPVAKRARPKKGASALLVTEGADGTEDETPAKKIKRSGSEEPDVEGTAVGTRRKANGTVGSVYSGSKIRHIKKADGIPLWRKDIQYAFLHEVVHDETKCFTRISDGKKDCTFAEIYIDSMARSSKTSRILKDRLQVDKPAAQNMAMICLLVNVGRMNTTLNFFPEMRAQLRTYHPIPALQAYPTQKDYKSLQDAPRLKSILKGASEDEEQPRTLPQLREKPVPRTNPVNLIFVLSQAANEVSQMHFLDKIDFFDLAIRPSISSHSRAVAFLWLMWWYLESDFTKEAALNNPFGPGECREGQDPENPDDIPLLVPKLEPITEQQGDDENVDPQEEIDFGAKMTQERERFNAKAEEDAALEGNGREFEHKGIKKLKRTARDMGDDIDSSDIDSVRASPGVSARSPAPLDLPGQPSSILQADSIEDDWEAMESHPGRGRYKRVKGKNTPSRSRQRQSEPGFGSMRVAAGRSRLGLNSDRDTPDTGRGTPQPPGINHPVLTQYPDPRQPIFDASHMSTAGMPSSMKSRARTGYQKELEEHKQKRIGWLVSKKRRQALKEQKRKREQAEPTWLLRDIYRISQLPDLYDSEEDDSAAAGLTMLPYPVPYHRGTGIGGIIPLKRNNNTPQLSKQRSNDNQSPVKDERGEDTLDSNFTADNDLEDYLGEEVEDWNKVFLRTHRRLDAWSGDKDYQRFLRNRQQEEHRLVLPPVTTLPGLVPSLPPSSVNNETPRKPRHESKKSLEEEINEDLLAERSADEGEDDEKIDAMVMV